MAARLCLEETDPAITSFTRSLRAEPVMMNCSSGHELPKSLVTGRWMGDSLSIWTFFPKPTGICSCSRCSEIASPGHFCNQSSMKSRGDSLQMEGGSLILQTSQENTKSLSSHFQPPAASGRSRLVGASSLVGDAMEKSSPI